MNGTELGVLSIRVVEWSVMECLKGRRGKNRFFLQAQGRLEINPVGMNPFHNAP